MGLNAMHAEKVSISLSADLAEFVEHYKTAHACKSRSQVIETAVDLLRQRELEQAYRAAAQEHDTDFDITTADGLHHEAW